MLMFGSGMGVCNDPGLALILSFIKRAMKIICILAPIFAIVGCTFAYVKMMSSPDEKKYKNLIKNIILSLAIIFFLPLIINLVMKFFDGSFELASCWNRAEEIAPSSGGSHYIDINK